MKPEQLLALKPGDEIVISNDLAALQAIGCHKDFAGQTVKVRSVRSENSFTINSSAIAYIGYPPQHVHVGSQSNGYYVNNALAELPGTKAAATKAEKPKKFSIADVKVIFDLAGARAVQQKQKHLAGEIKNELDCCAELSPDAAFYKEHFAKAEELLRQFKSCATYLNSI